MPDFGVAKVREASGDGDVTELPTVTADGTRDGVILGTAASMSPEQARGQSVDRRTYIWAFGCVLYEMLTGRAAFAGATVSDTLARVLEHEPDWSRLRASAAPGVRSVLGRCLAKDPKQRFRDIGDVRIALEDAIATDVSRPIAPRTESWRRSLPWLVAITGAVGSDLARGTERDRESCSRTARSRQSNASSTSLRPARRRRAARETCRRPWLTAPASGEARRRPAPARCGRRRLYASRSQTAAHSRACRP